MAAVAPYFLLAFDGGGSRGIYAARLLRHLESCAGKPLRDTFQTIIGTSTGAILAAGVAYGKNGSLLESSYQRLADKIFRYRPWSLCGLLCSQYSHRVLQSELKSLFGTVRLGDLKQHLAIPVMNLTHGQPTVFDSRASQYRDIPSWKAVQAACAAQSFFDPVHIGDSYYCDGGLWAYDPTLRGVTDALQRGVPLSSIRVLSLGSGVSTKAYPPRESNPFAQLLGWGLGTRWRVQRLVNLVLNLQKAADAQTLAAIIPESSILRINFTSPKPLLLDNPSDIPFLLNQADADFSARRRELQDFIQG